MSMDFEKTLQVLTVLSDTLTVPHTLDEGIQRITEMTGVIMDTEQTVLLLRDEERQESIVRTRVGIFGDRIRVGHPLDLPERLKAILWKLRSQHQINWVEAGIEDIGFPILVDPIRVKGVRVGLLITGKSRDDTGGFDRSRRRLFRLITTLASLVIENARAYEYLRQQFAQRYHELLDAHHREGATGDPAQQLLIASLNNPNKVVRLLAASFYKELAQAGFSPGQITTAVVEILDCVTRNETTRP